MTGESEQFVGRARELAELAAVVRDGRGGVVLVAGEAGVGKSRLVAEAVRDARSAVVWGTCWDGDGAPPFWPWVPVIRACLASEAGRVWRDRPDPSVAEVMALLPEESGSTPAADASRFRLFEGVTRALRVAGGADGLIVVLDDLQWGDEASVRLLGFAARGLLDEPVVIVGTYRDDEVGPDHPLAAVSAELAGRLRHLELTGLDADELAAFVRSQRDGDGALAAEQVADLHRVTGGNPFFAREVLALVGGERSRASMRVPAGVRAVIERRLARLSHACDDALKVAAVIGTSFSLEVVAGAMGIAVADVLGVLGDALEAGVVVVESVPGDMRFAHDLLRKTVYESIPAVVRAGTHAQVAAALEQRRRGTGASPATVAHHLIGAVPLVEPARAAGAAVRAGEAAMAVLAHEEAGDWFERALSLMRSGDAGEPDAIGALLGLGEARLRGGDLPGARDAYVEAASTARLHGRSDNLALAALGLGAGLGGFEISLFDHVQIELLEEALGAVSSADSPRRAQLLARLSVALSFVSEERRLGLATEAVAMARRLGDGPTLGYALAAYCDAISGPTHSEARRDAAAEVVSLGVRAGERRLELLGRRLLLAALLELGEIADVDAQIRAFGAAADTIREPLYRWYVPLWRGMRALMAGRIEESAASCDEAEAVGALAHSANAAMLVMTQRWVRLRVEGRLAEAAQLIDDKGFELFGELAGSYAVTALSRLHTGDVDAARAQLRGFVVDLDRIPMDAEWLPTISQLAELAAGLGDGESAAVLDPVMAPFDDRVVVEGIGAAVYGTLGGFRARLLALLGREDEARELEIGATAAASRLGLVAAPRALDQPTHLGQFALDRDDRVAFASREADLWLLTFAGRTGRVRDSKGIRDLAALLANPGVGVHVSELMSTDAAGRAAVSSRGEPALDRRALAEYRRRLAELDDELAEAETHHDEGRAARLAAEREFLRAELVGAVGLGGHARRLGDDADRARKAVRARVRDAIARIEEVHPALGRHLARAVRTGTFCSYDPEKPVRWTVRL